MNKLSSIFSICFAFLVQTWLWIGCGNNPAESDKTPPTVVITQPINDATLTEPITIKADAVDNNGIKQVEFVIDGELIGTDPSAPYEQFWNVSFWADGDAHRVFAKALDNSGNVGQSALISVTVSEDAIILPELVSPKHDSIITETNNITLTWRSSPQTTNYEVIVSSELNFTTTEFLSTLTDTFITTTLTEGMHYWRVRAQNNIGLWSDWSVSWKFLIVDYLIFGHFFGFCGGEECIEIFKLESNKLLEDINDNYPWGRDFSFYNGNYIVLDHTKFDLVKNLLDYFPDSLLNENNTVIGCPDCVDQGGLYIEYNFNGIRRFWIIDQFKHNVPNYLHDFMDKINEKIILINN